MMFKMFSIFFMPDIAKQYLFFVSGHQDLDQSKFFTFHFHLNEISSRSPFLCYVCTTKQETCLALYQKEYEILKKWLNGMLERHIV